MGVAPSFAVFYRYGAHRLFILFIALVFLLTFLRSLGLSDFRSALASFCLHCTRFLRRIGVFTFMDCPVFPGFKAKFLLYFLRHVAGYVAVVSDAALYVLLWLLVYLLHYWVIYQRRILFFYYDRCLCRGDRYIYAV